MAPASCLIFSLSKSCFARRIMTICGWPESLGLKTAFIARPSEYGPHQCRDLEADETWDIIATSVENLADQLTDQVTLQGLGTTSKQ